MRAGVLLTLTLCGCGAQPAVDAALERMKDQPRYDVYEHSGFFADSAVMQTPPQGTVPRERVLDPALATGRAQSGEYLRDAPLASGPERLALGRTRFEIFCAVCHGIGGYGGSVVAMNLGERRPPSLRRPELRFRPAGYYYDVIRNGVGGMPSYAAELSVSERWAVVAYLRQLQARDTAMVEGRDDSTVAAGLRRLDSLRVLPP